MILSLNSAVQPRGYRAAGRTFGPLPEATGPPHAARTMALNALRGRRARGKRPGPVPPQPLAIGEVQGDVFNCPMCARPLAPGAGRCPGCGVRLFMGVAARKAGFFLGLGLFGGLILGGAGVAASADRAGRGAGVLPTPPGASAPVVVPPSAGGPAVTQPPGPSVPAMARSALGQAAELHVRLATAGDSLQAFLRADDLDASAVARVLRSLASDATYGASLGPRIASWPDAKAHSDELIAFYGSVRQTAREGLRASVTNEAAYRAAGEEMVTLLAGLGPVDDRTRALAADAGVDVPPRSAATGQGATAAPLSADVGAP